MLLTNLWARNFMSLSTNDIKATMVPGNEVNQNLVWADEQPVTRKEQISSKKKEEKFLVGL